MLIITTTATSINFTQAGGLPILKPKNSVDCIPYDKGLRFTTIADPKIVVVEETWDKGIMLDGQNLTTDNYAELLNEALFS